jgi:hypothetical protein
MRCLRVPFVLALAAAGCASGGEEPRSGWGGVVEERPPPPAPLTGAISVPTPSVRPYATREFTAEERAFFDRAWTSFKRGDASWPEMEVQWVSMGPEATGVLAENLYRAMVAARVSGALHLAEEARKDLVFLGEGAVPVLVGGLSVRAVRDDQGNELRVGQEVLHMASEALGLIGAPSVPGLMDIAASREPAVATEALWALGNVGDPRAEGLVLRLAEDPDWHLRAEAVLALRRYDTEAARARMVAALEDGEDLVIERAAQALATGRRMEAAPAIVDVLERAIRDGRILTSRACVFALQRITGDAKTGADPAGWRARLSR